MYACAHAINSCMYACSEHVHVVCMYSRMAVYVRIPTLLMIMRSLRLKGDTAIMPMHVCAHIHVQLLRSSFIHCNCTVVHSCCIRAVSCICTASCVRTAASCTLVIDPCIMRTNMNVCVRSVHACASMHTYMHGCMHALLHVYACIPHVRMHRILYVHAHIHLCVRTQL